MIGFVRFASAWRWMLRCNMKNSTVPPLLDLEDLLGDLQVARSQGDLGRLALLTYCEVRRWARRAGETGLAEHSSELITRSRPSSREAFMAQMDELIAELQLAHCRAAGAQPGQRG